MIGFTQIFVGGSWTNPIKKYAQVKLDHFPNNRSENKKYQKKMNITQVYRDYPVL